MSTVWTWMKKWGVLVGGILLAILTLGLAGGFAVRKLWRDKLQAEDKAKVEEAEREMAYLRGLREEVERDIGEESEAVEDIDRRIKIQKDTIAETMKTGAGLSDEEIAAAFDDLGY